MKKIIGLAVVISLLIAGCRSSYITSSWRAKDKKAAHYNKVLVLGLIRDNDRSLQQKMEDHLAGDLRDLGYNAVTSLQEYGPRAFFNLDEKAAIKKLQNSEIDAVVTIVLLNKTLEKQLVTTKRNMIIYDNNSRYGFYNYYHSMYNRLDVEDYYVTTTNYFWETNFYELPGADLVYSAQTKSFNPADAGSLGHEYGLMMVKDMKRTQVVEKQPKSILKGF